MLQECSYDLVILGENTEDTLGMVSAMKVTPYVQVVNDLGVAVLQTRVLIPVLGRSTADMREVLCTTKTDGTYCVRWYKSEQPSVIPGAMSPQEAVFSSVQPRYHGATLEAAWDAMLAAERDIMVIVGEDRDEALELAGAGDPCPPPGQDEDMEPPSPLNPCGDEDNGK